MRTEHLEYLIEVARTNSISAAAKKLFIGQTTLSAIINSIEQELNIEIFVRTHKGVKLTETGEQFIMIAEDMVEKNHMLQSLGTKVQSVRRVVPMVSYPSACCGLCLYISDRLREVKGDPTLSVYETVSHKIVSRVMDGTANIGIGASARNEFFSNQYSAHANNLSFEPVYTDHFALCVGKDSPMYEMDTVDVTSLGNEHLAVTDSYPCSSTTTVGGIFKYVSKLSVFSSVDVCKRAVMEQGMIAVLPRLACYGDRDLSEGNMRLVELTGFDTELTNFLVVNRKNGLNVYEEEIIRFIRDFYAQFTEEKALPADPG